MPNNYILLETIALTQSAASVTFDNLPTSGYTDLKIVMSGRLTAGASTQSLTVQFNGSTSGYLSRNLRGSGSAASSVTDVYGTDEMYLGEFPAANSTANTFGNGEIYIPNYISSNNKSVSADMVTENNATLAWSYLSAGLWANSSAITSIRLIPNAADFVANSTFSLYGLADVNTTPVTAPLATGGNIVGNDGTYWYHAFLSSGTFTPQTSLSCETLVIAGGGGCGADASGGGGGGGGAGGLVYTSSVGFSTASHTVTVGAGGAASTPNSGLQGTSGVNSSITGGSLSLTASVGGGGGGAGLTNMNGLTGGSGGGGGGRSGTGGSGGAATLGQGGAGGTGSNSSAAGAGGGGAGGAGGPGGSASGGVGSSTYSSWGLATVTGQNVSGTVYYAGGGAGWVTGSGGFGGGGSQNVNGTANTGGGGGAYTGAGGSGIVIIRYAMV